MKKQVTLAARIIWGTLFLFTSPLAPAEDQPAPVLIRSDAPGWPQWRGPWRDGVSEETGLLQSWPVGGPKCLGKISGIGKGYSSPIVVNDTVYVTGDQGDALIIHAFSLDGSRRWRSTNGAAWKRSYPGARASCTFDGNRLYHINAHGRVACLDAATGKEVWAVDVLQRFEAKNITWGISESLLVHGDHVIVTPCGAKGLMAALDKNTGATVWTTPPLEGEQPSYASPILVAAGQRRLVVNSGARYAFAVDADTGELYWKMRHLDPNTTITSTPILSGDRLVFTNTSREFGGMYGVRFDNIPTDKVWVTDLKMFHGGLVCVDGRLVGASSRGVAKGWVTIDAATGTAKQVGDLGRGSVLYADGRYYSLTEQGDALLQALTDEGLRTVGLFELTRGKDVWAHPVLCNGRLYLRYHETLFYYDVRS